jgi:aconitate hydratase
VNLELAKNGASAALMAAGAVMREAFCGPCFGAGDTPANGEFSIRHTTRNFPNREGSSPGQGQIASVALMDARSIAATAANGGRLTAATELDVSFGGANGVANRFFFDKGIYDKRAYDGALKPQKDAELVFGPNIKDWPAMPALPDSLLLKIVSFITDPVTTTDELIPSGETSSYRSNPLRLAEFTLSRKDPGYVGRAKEIRLFEEQRKEGRASEEIAGVLARIRSIPGFSEMELSAFETGSAIYARKPGDGSAREQAASCQRVLGGSANFALEYATKRYRSNLINWGILPFVVQDEGAFGLGDYVFFPDIRKALLEKTERIRGYVIGEASASQEAAAEITAELGELTDAEREILAAGCLINYYRNMRQV